MEMGFPGVIVAAILWIFGSILFTAYVYHFDSYNKTYGSLGAPLALLTWMWLLLFGAEINGEAERQTRQDTTAGAPLPMAKGDKRARR